MLATKGQLIPKHYEVERYYKDFVLSSKIHISVAQLKLRAKGNKKFENAISAITYIPS